MFISPIWVFPLLFFSYFYDERLPLFRINALCVRSHVIWYEVYEPLCTFLPNSYPWHMLSFAIFLYYFYAQHIWVSMFRSNNCCSFLLILILNWLPAQHADMSVYACPMCALLKQMAKRTRKYLWTRIAYFLVDLINLLCVASNYIDGHSFGYIEKEPNLHSRGKTPNFKFQWVIQITWACSSVV